MSNDYIISTGYYAAPNDKFLEDFYHIWYNNVTKYSNPKRIIVANAGCKKPEGAKGEWMGIILGMFQLWINNLVVQSFAVGR